MKSKNYYKNENLWGRTELTLVHRQVLNFLAFLCDKLPENARIADLGCGDGILLKEIVNQYPGLNGYGVDFSRKALQHLAPNLNPCLADLTSLPFDDGFFNLCFCLDVLEHIIPSKLNRIVAEIHRVCSGPVLIVSPFLESDAVRTICPHCSCVFSPYYHLNRFSFKLWERLIFNHIEGRTMCFVPMGELKTYIPSGLGPVLGALGNYVTHNHKTICPQCETNFSRSAAGDVSELSILLGPYAAQNRNSFGRIFEEMGVLTVPKIEMNRYHQKNTFEGIWITGKTDFSIEKDKIPALIVQSVYEIDFEDPDVISSGADLFKSPAYVIDNGRLKKSDNCPGVFWRTENIENSLSASTLRLVFPPEPDRKNVTLELFFSAQAAGNLCAILNALPPHNSIQVGITEVIPSQNPNCMIIKLMHDDNFVTPYGLLVDLVWKPQLNSSSSASGLTLHNILHHGRKKKNFSLQTTGFNPWPLEPDLRDSYKIHLISDTVSNLKYGYKGRMFDLTGHLIPKINGIKTVINLPLYGGLFENSIDKEIKSDSKHETHQFSLDRRIYISIYKDFIKNANNAEQFKRELEVIKQDKNKLELIQAEIEQELAVLKQHKIENEVQIANISKELSNLKNTLEIFELEKNYLMKHISFLKNRNIVQRIFNRN